MLRDYAHVKTSVSQKEILLKGIDAFIGGMLMIAVFLMFTGFLYLIK